MSAPSSPESQGVVERFLGRSAASGGPFALLALTPEDCTEELVILQLQRQLAKIAAHPDAYSTHADELRLALHAAAAQLLEHIPRLEPHESTLGEAADPGDGSREALAQTGLTPAAATMEQAFVATLAAHGGWNKKSLHRLSLIAASRGVVQEDFGRAVQGFLRQSPAPAAAPSPGAPDAPVESAVAIGDIPTYVLPEQRDPARRAVITITLVLAGGLGLLLLAAWVLVAIAGRPAKPAPKPQDIADAGQQAPAPRPDAPPRELFPSGALKPTETPDAAPLDATTLLRELSSATAQIDTAPDAAIARFVELLASAGAGWTRFGPDQIVAFQSAAVEFAYRVAPRPDQASRCAEAILAGVRDAEEHFEGTSGCVARAVLSAGLTARLARERDLPSEVTRQVQAALRGEMFRTLGSDERSFPAGASAALVATSRRLTPLRPQDAESARALGEAWTAWLAGVDALGLRGSERERLVLLALDALVREGPDSGASPATFAAISTLTAGLGWGEASQARARLLGWFDSPEVGADDLHAITSVLASKGLSIGVDSTMVLSRAAGEAQRPQLRDRYREAWGGQELGARAASAKAWAERAKEMLDASAASDEPVDRLLRAIALSRQIEVAAAMWVGQAGPGSDAPPNPRALSTLPPGTLILTLPDPQVITADAWIIKWYAAQQRIPERKELLRVYRSGQEDTRSMEAAAIVHEALRGSPPDVRKAAADIVRANADDPTFVNALLVESPTMPLTKDSATLAAFLGRAPLPSMRSPTFRVAVRRGLVERLLELLSGDGPLRGLDPLSESLGQSYWFRAKFAGATPVDAPPDAGTEPAPDESDAQGTPAPPKLGANQVPIEESARVVRQRLQGEASQRLATGREPLGLLEVEQRRLGRLRLAQGRLQQFAAEQACMVDLMVFLVASENLDHAPAAKAILDDFSAARRKSRHIIEQIEQGEAALLRLWILRFAEATP